MNKFLPTLLSAILLLAPANLTIAAEPWSDHSPHKQSFLPANGINLECLDWGGTGEPMVFLAGLGISAHIFDDFAPQFTNHFRVVALTRRGIGASDKPKSGYDIPTLVEDIRQSLDALGLKRVILVGHSFGCQEAAAFAITFPERTSKVVYLDGAYTFTPEMVKLEDQIGPLVPHPSAQDTATASALLKWFRQNRPGWNAACETDLRARQVITAQGTVGQGTTPPFVFKTLIGGIMNSPVDFSKVTAPALVFFTDKQHKKLLASLSATAPDSTAQLLLKIAALEQDQEEHFKNTVKNAKIIKLTDTDHFCFIQRPDEIAKQMREFLLQPQAP